MSGSGSAWPRELVRTPAGVLTSLVSSLSANLSHHIQAGPRETAIGPETRKQRENTSIQALVDTNTGW
ncbi:MAG: hypothetical protein BroJett022_22630 [Actinomycetes bacterium]|nr:MAG: hypothetical protein BroJett022_22630 [Actinomycetes bacterium]